MRMITMERIKGEGDWIQLDSLKELLLIVINWIKKYERDLIV